MTKPARRRALRLAALFGLIAAGIYLAYQVPFRVDPQDETLVLRDGQVHRVALPGLRFKLPFVEDLHTCSVAAVHRISHRYSDLPLADRDTASVDAAVDFRIADCALLYTSGRDPQALSGELQLALDVALPARLADRRANELAAATDAIARDLETTLQAVAAPIGGELFGVRLSFDMAAPADP